MILAKNVIADVGNILQGYVYVISYMFIQEF